MHPVKEREKLHRKAERQYVQSAKFMIAAKDYAQAIKYLAWAIQQEAAADIAATCMGIVQAREAMATARTRYGEIRTRSPRAKEKSR